MKAPPHITERWNTKQRKDWEYLTFGKSISTKDISKKENDHNDCNDCNDATTATNITTTSQDSFKTILDVVQKRGLLKIDIVKFWILDDCRMLSLCENLTSSIKSLSIQGIFIFNVFFHYCI
eukprot:TRINITY_DN12569_c0_g1_i1.p1 TRINITY_DN12569_c0_g1~~TRINITY_DN12569_c0_g1_i1.p1  ORF type:complete len:133 (+),score=33.78 TRINITY_DN12569_c0_g1_i1:35-400(+)